MAAPKKIPELEELAKRAAEEILKRDPHFGDPPQPYTDAEYAAFLEDEDRFYREVMIPASEQGKGGKLPSELIDEDRGE